MRLVLILLVALCAPVAAQPADGGDPVALALFDEGRELIARGDLAAACTKFEAARERVAWIGVALNLADCYERTGRTASAWALFRKIADDAARRDDARATYARDRAAGLEPSLARIAITGVADTLQLDGEPITAGIAIPVDPGEHVIAASAPGRTPWSRTVMVEPSARVEVAVPELAPIFTPRLSPSAPPIAPRRVATTGRRVALALGTVGTLALGASLIIALDARLDHSSARSHCDAELRCDPFGFRSLDDARRRGNAATILGGAGLATLVTALVVHYSSPRERVIAPIASPTTVGFAIGGKL